MNAPRPPRLAALTTGIAVFVLYILTLAPTTAFWDASEYIATAHILGIPHPPGNPLFVVLGKAWSLLLAPLGLSVAVRINLFAAFTTAVSCGFLFLIAHRFLREAIEDRVALLVGAGVSALLAATAFTVWNQSNVNEKVYTVSVMIHCIVTWLAIRWWDQRNDPRASRLLILALFLLVLGSTNHLMSLLPGPALGVLILMGAPGILLRGDFWGRAVPVVLLGLSFNFFLPIRADERPVINEGDPVCESLSEAAVAVFSKGRAGGCPALASVLTREQYQKPPVSERMAPLSHQLLNWFQYFDWQWSRGLAASEIPGNARLPISLLFLFLGGVGLAMTARAGRGLFAYMAITAVLLTVGLVFYLNFRYGYSLAPEITNPGMHEVRERDYFFIGGFLFWGGFAGMGLSWLWTRLGARVGEGRRGLLLASPVLLIAVVPLVLNWSWASRAGDWSARSWAYNLLMSVEPYGIIFTNGDNDTFPLWYLQEVEGIRPDVTVIVGQYLYTTWYPKQLAELTAPDRQRPFPADQDGSGHLLPPGGVRAPTRPILTLSEAELDGLGGYQLSQDLTVPIGSVAVRYPAGTILDRLQLVALRIIGESFNERPIHFSGAGGLLSDLGLAPWAVRRGMAMQLLMEDPVDLDPDGSRYVATSARLGGEWLDMERTRALSEEVFLYDGIRDRAIWADRASLNIPSHYYFLYLMLADAGSRSGVPEATLRAWEGEALRYLTVAEGGEKGTP